MGTRILKGISKFGILMILSAHVWEKMFSTVAPSYAGFAMAMWAFGAACGVLSLLWITRS